MQRKSRAELRLSPSLAKIIIHQGPKQAYEAATRDRSIPYKRSASMRFGAAVDRLVFGCGDEIVTKMVRAQPELPGTILVTEKELERAEYVACAVQAMGVCSSPGLGNQQGAISVQSKLAWFDKELGLELVSKPDYLDRTRRLGKDLKTSRDLSDYAIARDIEQYGYDIQAAAYVDAMTNCLGWTDPGFSFVFAETSPPYHVRVITLDADQVENGTRLWQEAKHTWKRCLDTGVWPDEVAPKYKARQIKTKDWLNK